MKKLLLLAGLLIFCPFSGQAQLVRYKTSAGAPSGNCNQPLLVDIDTTNNNIYLCNGSTWVGPLSAGGVTASGTLTSGAVVVGAGTTVVSANANNASLSSGALTLGSNGVAGSVILNGATSGTTTLSASATGGTLNLGSTNATVTSAGALTVASCTGCGGGGAALSAITNAAGSNTLANGDNPQIWDWATTTSGRVAFTIGETSASVSAGTPYELRVFTAAGSTATPLKVDNSLTGSQTLPALAILPIWNTTGVVDAALLVNPTNTASGTGSLLADFQLGGTSQWKVDKAGNSTQLGSATAGSIISTTIKDANGNPFILSSATASAVDGLTAVNAATANPATVKIQGTGSDSNINVEIDPKGTGVVQLGPSGGVGGGFSLPEGTTQSASASNDVCYGDSTAHGIKCANNNGSFTQMVLAPSSTTTTQALFATATAGIGGYRAIVAGDLPNVPLNQVISATGAIATIADGNNPLTINCAQTSNTQACGTFGETSAATNGTLTNALANQSELSVSTASASTAAPLNVTQGSVTGTNAFPAFQVQTTWNNAGLTGVGFLLNATDTSSASGSLLMQLRKGNTNQFIVDKSGNATAATSVATGTAPACTAGTSGILCIGEGTVGTGASATGQLGVSSTTHEWYTDTNGGGTGMLESVKPGQINQTAQTAAISTATLCAASAGACNQAGQYRVEWNFWGSGTACSNVTAGSVTFLLTWTDENAVAHSAVALQMMGQTGAATEAMGSTFPFQTALANESASGDFTFSTNGSVIQYATGYTACTTGTGTYNLRASVTRLQ